MNENLKVAFVIFMILLLIFGVTRIFVFHDKDLYCKLRFGEEYTDALSTNHCYSTNYETGIKQERFYTEEQLEEYCQLPEYFSFKWKGVCSIPSS